jgi:Mrp family chromosome partitioning ATPase
MVALVGSHSCGRGKSPQLRPHDDAFGFVIVDAPPLARYPDATALAKLSEGIVLVLEAGTTRRRAARKAVKITRLRSRNPGRTPQ